MKQNQPQKARKRKQAAKKYKKANETKTIKERRAKDNLADTLNRASEREAINIFESRKEEEAERTSKNIN